MAKNDMTEAKPGQLFIRNGELWEVIGFYSGPSVELQKVGTRFVDVNRVSLVADSPWACDWVAADDSQALEIMCNKLRSLVQ